METVTITLPKSVYKGVEDIVKEGFKSEEEFIKESVHSFALAKMWEYRNEMLLFERKYNMKFEVFKHKVETAKKENFEEWDDLILWEGLHRGYMLWKKRCEAIKDVSHITHS